MPRTKSAKQSHKLPNVNGLNQKESKRYRELSARLGHLEKHWEVTSEEFAEWQNLSNKIIAANQA